MNHIFLPRCIFYSLGIGSGETTIGQIYTWHQMSLNDRIYATRIFCPCLGFHPDMSSLTPILQKMFGPYIYKTAFSSKHSCKASFRQLSLRVISICSQIKHCFKIHFQVEATQGLLGDEWIKKTWSIHTTNIIWPYKGTKSWHMPYLGWPLRTWC